MTCLSQQLWFFYNQEQVAEVRAQKKERKKEARYPEKQKRKARHAQMMMAYRAKGSRWYPNHTQVWLHKVLYLPPSRTLCKRMSPKGQATCHCLPKMQKVRALGYPLLLNLKGSGV